MIESMKRKRSIRTVLIIVASFILVVIFLAVGYYFCSGWFNSTSEKASSILQKKDSRIVIFGDTRSGHQVHRQIVSKIFELRPEAIFHVGDAVEDGNDDAQWSVFNGIESVLIKNHSFYIAAGNHDEESPLFYNNFQLPGNEKWYSVDLGNVHWAVLNSNLSLDPGSEQWNWLEKDLSANKESNFFKAIVMHHSMYTSGKHAKDLMPYKQALTNLFQDHNVSIVFSGHDHLYERSYKAGIFYEICGASGAPLAVKSYENPYSQKFSSTSNYCVLEEDGDSLKVRAYNQDAHEIDHFSVTK